ncbi:MAG: recombinase family protein [Defluviitaleaceae bacterium]|nr:recombinase family protein [Defluviitaleaceae bacterium]
MVVSYDTIIDELNAKGFRGKKGQVMGRSSLNAILQNSRYMGVYSWNKYQNKYMGKGAKKNEN